MAVAPQFRLIDNRRNDTELLNAVFGSVDEFRRIFYKKLIDEIVNNSPVDTGTYMESHEIQEGRTDSVGTNSSRGKPRFQQREPYANSARSKLYAQIDALTQDHRSVHIGNYSVHAPLVEYGGAKMPIIYAPYTRARASTPRFIREAIEELRT
jgi:hypothetical protein